MATDGTGVGADSPVDVVAAGACPSELEGAP